MAKGKHSAALFEVINSRQADRAGQSLRTPKWWFKGRPAKEAVAPGESEMASAPSIEAERPAPEPSPAATPPRQSTIRPGPRSSAVQLDFDKSRKELTLRLRYTTALVTAFGVCALIGIAYVIGRHISHGPQVASAEQQSSIPQLMNRPPQPGVTDPARPHTLPHPTGNELPQPRRTPDVPPNAGTPKPAAPVTLVPASAEVGMPRVVGLNYAIIQTYPPEEAANAEAARDFLNKSGIPCTIEKTDYVRNPNWVCLVGTAGFTKISSPDYRTYVDNIVRLGEKFTSSHFDRFKPAAYKWKG